MWYSSVSSQQSEEKDIQQKMRIVSHVCVNCVNTSTSISFGWNLSSFEVKNNFRFLPSTKIDWVLFCSSFDLCVLAMLDPLTGEIIYTSHGCDDDVRESEDATIECGENDFESNLRRRKGKIISCAKETIEHGESIQIQIYSELIWTDFWIGAIITTQIRFTWLPFEPTATTSRVSVKKTSKIGSHEHSMELIRTSNCMWQLFIWQYRSFILFVRERHKNAYIIQCERVQSPHARRLNKKNYSIKQKNNTNAPRCDASDSKNSDLA